MITRDDILEAQEAGYDGYFQKVSRCLDEAFKAAAQEHGADEIYHNIFYIPILWCQRLCDDITEKYEANGFTVAYTIRNSNDISHQHVLFHIGM